MVRVVGRVISCHSVDHEPFRRGDDDGLLLGWVCRHGGCSQRKMRCCHRVVSTVSTGACMAAKRMHKRRRGVYAPRRAREAGRRSYRPRATGAPPRSLLPPPTTMSSLRSCRRTLLLVALAVTLAVGNTIVSEVEKTPLVVSVRVLSRAD